MSLIKLIRNSRKAYNCSKCGRIIPIGSSYRLVSPYKRAKQHICMSCKCRPWEFSGSEYTREAGSIVEDWQENFAIEDAAEGIADSLQELLDHAESSLENLTEVGLQDGDSGMLLQERVDFLNDAINMLGDVDYQSTYDNIKSEVEQEATEDNDECCDVELHFSEKIAAEWIDNEARQRAYDSMVEQIDDALSVVAY